MLILEEFYLTCTQVVPGRNCGLEEGRMGPWKRYNWSLQSATFYLDCLKEAKNLGKIQHLDRFVDHVCVCVLKFTTVAIFKCIVQDWYGHSHCKTNLQNFHLAELGL